MVTYPGTDKANLLTDGEDNRHYPMEMLITLRAEPSRPDSKPTLRFVFRIKVFRNRVAFRDPVNGKNLAMQTVCKN